MRTVFPAVLAVVLLPLAQAVAQAPSPQELQAIQRQQEQILQQQEQRQRELERQREEGARRPPEVEGLPQPPQPGPTDGAACVEARQIAVTGVTKFSEAEIARLAEPYAGRCLTLGEVNDLLRDITNRYIEAGYATTRAYVPQQDLRGGTLTIVVVEGVIQGLRLNDGTGAAQRQLATAFPGLDGEVLDLRDIEQGLDQMNRLKSNNARLKLEPGDRLGTSRVVIENDPAKFWRLGAALDNSGQKATGEQLRTVSAEADNLLDLNDFLSVSWSKDLHGDSSRLGSEAVSGFLSVPYGYWVLSLSSSWSAISAPSKA